MTRLFKSRRIKKRVVELGSPKDLVCPCKIGISAKHGSQIIGDKMNRDPLLRPFIPEGVLLAALGSGVNSVATM